MTLENWLAHPAVQALGRALLHFLWQGSVLAMAVWIVKAIAPPSAARLRYAMASAILLTMPATLLFTAVWSSRGAQTRTGPVAAPRILPHAPRTASEQEVYYAPSSLAPHAGFPGWAACIWTIGVLALSARMAGGWMGLRKLKRGACPAGEALHNVMEGLKERLRVTCAVRLCMSTAVQVPTVIGWIRPYLVLPVTALSGLSETQMRAILAHELAHIRRNDYLLNAIQTVIETLLFYHPAVWWVGRQMRLEREHCCDDMAVAVCGSPLEYASALAEMEEIRGRIPTLALAASGGELLGRIQRVLGRAQTPRSTMGGLAAAALALFIAGTAGGLSIFAASQEQPAFEVASIKRDASEGRIFRSWFPTFHAERQTLKALILLAYQIHDFQLAGGPGWIDSERYDIDAKSEERLAAGQQHVNLQRQRLQTLLRDRFHLTFHRETKEVPIYELVLAKGGPKLQPATCINRETGDTALAPGKKDADYCGATGMGRGRIESPSSTMAFLASNLSLQLGQMVVDKTGLAGGFRIHLVYTPAGPAGVSPDGTPAGAATEAGLDIGAALQEQLGLKLQPAKGAVEILVIDHVEKPSEN